MLRIVTFKLDEDLLEALDSYAKAKKMSRSEAIREAIKRMLEAEGWRVQRQRRRRTEKSTGKIEFEIIV